MSGIAALGFGDIPVPAFVQSYNLIQDGGTWKSTIWSGRHRVSINGTPLFY
jgi:hypothetical protein